MPIRVALHHRTSYAYDRPVILFPQVVRLRPAPHARTPILSYSLKIEPEGFFLNWLQDPYSNYLARVVFQKPVRSFAVTVDLIAEMVPINPFDFFVEAQAEHYPFAYDALLAKELVPYLETEPAGPGLRGLIGELRRRNVKTLDYLVEINQQLKNKIAYTVRMEPGVQTCEETIAKASGSCRDTAWLMVQLCRHLGLAARFASGYLIQLKPDEKSLDGPSGTAVDFTDLHAWTEVYAPGAGWIGLDPTSGLLCAEGHIPLACTATPQTAAPISGAIDVSGNVKIETEFAFDMQLTRLREEPRVTFPYTEETWEKIDALGHRIDERLASGDARLTMGGEPTFVSIDDRDGDEWNTAALGKHKRERALELFRRLSKRFGSGALLHFGQGKWYPGEQLPRWALGCYWRADGEAVWSDPSLIADEGVAYGFTAEHAERFIAKLASNLKVESADIMAAREDPWHALMKERMLPANVDPLKNNLDDPLERARLAAIFERGLKAVVGYALPLKKDGDAPKWRSGRWELRREHLFLIPGDSPMGYRLPLDSLPWEKPEERDTVIEVDPSAPRGVLAKRGADRQEKIVPATVPGPAAIRPVIRTTLCVEPRGGRLMVFLPPQEKLEDYLNLVEAVEATASELKMPVQVEGYAPPRDSRLVNFSVTPDPGVIEVNIQPAADWGELSAITEAVYEEARQSRLCAEKFMADGRHTGTGGGNHVILGGATVADSPLLRRPHLLRSLIGYWNNHPSLTYLFSGMFVGPTSQAPRLDEARNDSLYEMEIAFREVPEAGEIPPWLVDRIFRHLLTDVTGNTHRSEFCIDKLYSPDSTSGRLGLLELRAFEMPPHPRMSLTQQLLLRSLVARFWDSPYKASLIRWGTELHDRFLLPHFVDADFRAVVDDQRRAGVPLEEEWFRPHFDFRFPKVGEISPAGVVLELRHAIEPWHVLGEEVAAGGTARYVDSSVERMQVKVAGFVEGRYLVACNGRRVPLHPTGTNGEYVAGVRYRAWQPPSCLHPTIGVDAPLVFDLVDTWNGRSIGGCTYHVSHPGGRSPETAPVNALEAAGRRSARFAAMGHTPGPMAVPPEGKPPEAPLTLDLRIGGKTL